MRTALQRLLKVPAVEGLRTRIESASARAYCRLHGVPHIEAVFDRQYYLSRYPDVRESGMDSLFHYLRFGATELRQPHPWFHTGYYLKRYPDVSRSGINPLIHFLHCGAFEGRQPHPEFDSLFYLENNPDVAGHIPLVHFI